MYRIVEGSRTFRNITAGSLTCQNLHARQAWTKNLQHAMPCRQVPTIEFAKRAASELTAKETYGASSSRGPKRVFLMIELRLL